MSRSNQLFKGSLNTILLKMLGENDRMYGYEITRKVMELSGDKIQLTEGALYPALHRLEADGLLEVTIEKVGNRNRKYYSLTKKGKTESKLMIKEITGFIEQMQHILQLKPAVIK